MSVATDAALGRTAEGIARDVGGLDMAAFETFLALRHFLVEFHSAFDRHFARYRLSPPRFDVLVALAYGDDAGETPARLADELGVARATMTGFLDGLERDGLVIRQRHPADRRKLSIRITPKAARIVKRLLPEHLRRITTTFRVLSDAEMKQLRWLITKVRRGLSAVRTR